MNLDDLKDTLSSNTLYYGSISSSAMINIMKFVNVKLLMDERTFEYYYEIDVDELLKSDFPKEELETLKNQGWSFSKNRDKLILFLN